MSKKPAYNDLGAIHLPSAEFLGFLKRPEKIDGASVVYVDPERFLARWYEQGTAPRIGSPPGPMVEWRPEEQASLIRNFAMGPRQPVTIPFVLLNNKGNIDVIAGRLDMQALLDWRAASIPVVTKDKHLCEIYDLVADPQTPPIPTSAYLSTKQKVLEACEKRIPVRELYTPDLQRYKLCPSLTEHIVNGIEDYARLIFLQLETMVVRHKMLQGNSILSDPCKREKGIQEVQRLLHQRACVSGWLSKPRDMENLPTWHPADAASRQEAMEFLDANVAKLNGHTHNDRHILQIATESSADKTAPVRSKGNPPHLKIISEAPKGLN